MRDRGVIFLVEEALEGGYEACAFSYSIYTQAETVEELREMVRDAVRCHFAEEGLLRVTRLHWVKGEVFIP